VDANIGSVARKKLKMVIGVKQLLSWSIVRRGTSRAAPSIPTVGLELSPRLNLKIPFCQEQSKN
jgi:hypothetical protein